METDKLELLRDLPIAADHWNVPVPLDPRAFTRFCQQMDEALARLVARWEHLASPNTRGRLGR